MFLKYEYVKSVIYIICIGIYSHQFESFKTDAHSCWTNKAVVSNFFFYVIKVLKTFNNTNAWRF